MPVHAPYQLFAFLQVYPLIFVCMLSSYSTITKSAFGFRNNKQERKRKDDHKKHQLWLLHCDARSEGKV